MKLAILGTVGVPGRYGGFETLAENLVRYAEIHGQPGDTLTVYCSARAYPDRPPRFLGAELRYSRLSANGPQSVLYDVVTILRAVANRQDTLLLLGVSGALILPVVRLFSRARIITNVDGVEWRRDKWQGLARRFLRWSEALAVRYSHAIISDNQGIADYLLEAYGIEAEVVAYGGDHALDAAGETQSPQSELPPDYALALCRIEPENKVEMILEAFDGASRPLVFVGNWNINDYGRELRRRFGDRPGFHLLEPIYEAARLYRIRAGAALYIHGHSAGGTNPSLVEMMHFGIPVLAYDCTFNRYTTENCADYFGSAEELRTLLSHGASMKNSNAMREIAQRRYRWEEVGCQYFSLLQSLNE